MARFPRTRLRRLRHNAALRELLATVRVRRENLVAPLFVCPGEGIRRKIASMPEQYHQSVDTAVDTARRWADAGLRGVLLFGVCDQKDPTGSQAWSDNGPVQRLIGELKRATPELCVFTDVCLCAYTDHGHCGILTERPDETRDVDNDATLEALATTALSHARAGADVVAPSAMMDGQVGAIRQTLDGEGLTSTAIMAYSVKYASALYGPFRDAANSAPNFGDRRTYQMDPRSPRQAVQEATADLDEGADILMVKPAGVYLDVIAELRRRFDAPLAAYHVSGEYAMLHAAAANGWLDLRAAVFEIFGAIQRAGADLIITYFAEQLANES
ncbi:MAG: porphobilinogen synthase [Phycisphaerae bacterium]|nr:porphobilinogen synthase [Phycisphaerae bacterium]